MRAAFQLPSKPGFFVTVFLLFHLLFGPASAGQASEGLLSLGEAENKDDTGTGLSALAAEIRKRIERARFYPDQARREGIEGTVELEFALSADGQVQEIWVLRSSGSSILDEAAIQVVKRAAPYPIAEDWPTVVRFQLPITYRLK